MILDGLVRSPSLAATFSFDSLAQICGMATSPQPSVVRKRAADEVETERLAKKTRMGRPKDVDRMSPEEAKAAKLAAEEEAKHLDIRRSSRSSTGYVGVRWALSSLKPYEARFNGHSLGCYETALEAAVAYTKYVNARKVM